jgi:hypothetical protein
LLYLLLSQFGRIQGSASITDDGDVIESQALDDVVIIGKVKMTIANVQQERNPVI